MELKKGYQISSLIRAIVQFGIGIIGSIVIGGVASAIYFMKSGVNAISVIINGVNIDKLKDLNKKLLSYKKKADILHNEIKKELFKLQSLLDDDKEAASIYF